VIFTATLIQHVRRPDQDAAAIAAAVSRRAGLALGAASLLLAAAAEHIIDVLAPGLAAAQPATRVLAVLQLRIMAPCAVLAGGRQAKPRS
jgi:peptidoglycan biosynthesis protein MviN/MurJ (putative lipid II flippase)